MILNLGPGWSGIGDVKIDLHQFPGVDHVLDLAIASIPYPNDTFDEVRAEQVLEHIPTQYRWFQDGCHQLRFCRVELMREIHRVLKPGGILHASVPVKWPEWAQDPTHIDIPWNLTAFTYFCGFWGGNEAGKEATESSGINFAFQMVEHFLNENESILTVKMRKPR